MIDLDEFARFMSEQGVDGPTRKSMLWLAQRLNDRRQEHELRLGKLERSSRFVQARMRRSTFV